MCHDVYSSSIDIFQNCRQNQSSKTIGILRLRLLWLLSLSLIVDWVCYCSYMTFPLLDRTSSVPPRALFHIQIDVCPGQEVFLISPIFRLYCSLFGQLLFWFFLSTAIMGSSFILMCDPAKSPALAVVACDF